jgi:hypothetical protein
MGLFSFLSSKGQTVEEKKVYETLAESLAQEYRMALLRNPQLPFQEEFIRTTNLEYYLIDRFGFSGIQLIFKDRKSENFFELGSFPEDCPWYHLNTLNKQAFIAANFASIKTKTPELIKAMTERCWFIFAEKSGDVWQLHYLLKIKLYDARSYYRIYTGGAPNKNPNANENLRKYQWEIPDALKKFYQIHNGFGEMNDGIAILNSTALKVMAEEMNPVSKQENTFPEGYRFDDLLEFFPDGSGNSQCFYRKTKGLTVDWDHETWELGEKMDFFVFINQHMSVLDEE